MKSKSTRFKPVEQLAEDRARNATEAMVTARNDLSQQKQKLSELMSYRNEYHEQMHNKARDGMTAGQLQQYQQFIAQLDRAIEQQQQAVHRGKQNLEQKQNHWQNKNSHKRAINKAVGRLRQQEQQDENRKEQLELDEHNIQSHFRKN